MRRILVIGPGGAGKTTLALRLGERLALPVVHLDAQYWRAGWTKAPDDAWTVEVARLVGGDAWVMDGNYSGTLDLRIPAADTIIFLDVPRLVCLWRIVKRRIRFHGRSRPDIHPECRERLTWEFVEWIWTYRSRRRAGVLDRLRRVAAEKRVVVLRSAEETERFVASVVGGSGISQEGRKHRGPTDRRVSP